MTDLQARGLSVAFEGVHAVEDVDVELAEGEVLGLIGPNGAGKTTVVNVLTGYVRPVAGEVRLGSRRVTRWGPGRRARAGVARTFQNVRLFGPLTVADNVRAAALAVGDDHRTASRTTRELLGRFHLDHRADALAASLPYGEARWLGMARAMALKPRFLMLDEPAAGLNEAESRELLSVLSTVPADYGCGLLVIDHDLRLIMGLCPRIQVLDHGRTIAVGAAAEVRAHDEVRRAYLGSDAA
ncbi:MAG TPA: ABC transporter ATP-binding protein [Conexibacter sp.]|jgi:branched-chain amino acid transport system ATP-binding protein|nr:ABC transporter ATP-binding protein [Conexibacter sp.]